MKGSFEIKGLDPFLEDIAAAGEDVDQVAREVLDEAAPVARDRMEEILRNTSEQWTGETADSLFAGPVQQDGNYIFFELGANTREEIAGLYKEFGTTRQAAEPFLRPSLTELRRTGIKRMLKALFERMGIATQ